MPEKEKGFLVADTNANEVLKNKEDKTIIKSFSDTKDTNQYINTETRTDSVIKILFPSVSSDSVAVEKINNLLPWYYYFSPVIIGLLFFITYKFKQFQKELIVGFLFFFVNSLKKSPSCNPKKYDLFILRIFKQLILILL